MQGQWRGHASWIEQGLANSPYLTGQAPGLVDIAAYMNIWWLSGTLRDTYAKLTEGFVHLPAWRTRMKDIGHGSRTEITSQAALDIARDCEPGLAPSHDPHDALGLEPGAPIVVMADDYGRDVITGTLVAANPERIVLARDVPDLGRLNLHFPRTGYIAVSAA